MKKIISLIGTCVQKIQEYICVITGASIAVLITMSAFMRYIIKKDFYGAEEIILLSAFWLYFMGSSLAAKDDTHINADMTSLFFKPERSKDIVRTIRYAVSLGLAVTATFLAFKYFMWSFGKKPTTNVLKIPLTLSQLPILLSFALMSVYTAEHLINSVKKLSGGKE